MAASKRSASALVVAGSVAALVAACGPPPTFHSASELAKAIDCQHFVAGPSSDDDTYAEKGSCDINGVPVDLFTFATDGRRDTAGDKIRAPIRGTGCC